MRKILSVFLILSCICLPLTALAENEITVSAKAGILVDEQGKVLFEKNADEKLPIASVTKVMTLDLVFSAIESGRMFLDEDVTVSPHASGMGGSQAFLDAGYCYKVSDLIKSVIIASANDSAVALAEHLSGSEEAFVSQMNRRASELGMTETTFANCTGLPEEGHLSTARDVAKMSLSLLSHEDYFSWSTVWQDEIYHAKDGRKTELVNTNKLIRSLAGCDGLKTGSTSEAKFCVTTTAKRGDERLVSVVLGGETSASRFDDAAKLINYGFANFEKAYPVIGNETLGKIKLNGGIEDEVEFVALNGISVCVRRDGSDEVTVSDELCEEIDAPVLMGDKIGERIVYVNGEEEARVDLVAKQDYAKANIFDKIKKFFK